MDNTKLLNEVKKRKEQLWRERTPWLEDYKTISELLMPRHGRFETSDNGQLSGKINTGLVDDTGTDALDVLAAGLMAGLTSPARPWFRLGIADRDLMQYAPVKDWLFKTTELMRDIFARSNTYRALHTMYEELGGFGTALSFVLPDFNDVIRMYPATAGEYAVATNERNEVDTVYREIPMMVKQVVAEFGLENCSHNLRTQWERGNLYQSVIVVHAIEPRSDTEREPGKRDGKNKAFRSVYFEATASEGKVLRESGFDTFPAIVPRWAVRGGDIYGTSPAFRAVGASKQLQSTQLRKGMAIDYQTNPPLAVPTQLRGQESDFLPGGVTYFDSANPNNIIRSAVEVKLDLQALLLDIEDTRGRLRKTMYYDLFLMLANDTRSNITATEIAERREEKLLMLGPVLERLDNEMISPLIDITFQRMAESGILPPPPKELEGMPLKVDLISTLAQAQRAVAITSVDRMLVAVGNLAQAKADPTVWDKIDTDQVIDGYTDMLGVDPQFVVPDDRVAELRQQRAQAQAEEQALAQASEMAKAANALGNTPTAPGTALGDVMQQFAH